MTASLFLDQRHLPFHFEAGGRTAVLMIHGFMGTPAELRPLGLALAEAGVDAIGMRLPGFGADLESLPQRRADDWNMAAMSEWRRVSNEFEQPRLLGFSLGASIAFQVASELQPGQLMVLSPFWKIPDWRAILLPLAGHVMSELKPWKNATFDEPAIRDDVNSIDPSLDPDDAATRERLREGYVIPTVALVRLQQAGRRGGDAAGRVKAPTLFIQGSRDDIAKPDSSKRLAERIRGQVTFSQFDVDHQLVRANRAAWPLVRDAVVQAATSGLDR